MIAQPHRMLMVEDNRAFADNVVEILGDLGYEVLPVGSAEEALPLLEDGVVGVITDLRLPGMSGMDLIAEMRHRGHTAPVILISAFAQDETVRRAEELGALEVLPKPLDFERLFELLEEVAGPRRRVLVLEDCAPLAADLAEALSQHDLQPLMVDTVRAALRQRCLPRVAVLDMRLPDGSGLEVARRLRARDPTVRVLVVTGYPGDLEPGEPGDALARETHVLRKPISVERLIAAIQAASDGWPLLEH